MKLHESWQLKADKLKEPSDLHFIQNIGEANADGYMLGVQNCLDAVEAMLDEQIAVVDAMAEKFNIKPTQSVTRRMLLDLKEQLQTLKPL